MGPGWGLGMCILENVFPGDSDGPTWVGATDLIKSAHLLGHRGSEKLLLDGQ